MSLLYLAAYAREKIPDAHFAVLDAQGLDLPLKAVEDTICRHRWDVVGVTSWTAQAEGAFRLADLARERTDATVMLGGVHATLRPEEAAEHADVAVVGEGELTFQELLEHLAAGEPIDEVAGIAYRRDGRFVLNPRRPFIDDLDQIPFPAWDLLPFLERYNSPMHIVGGQRMPVVGSRGCPFNCTFCSSPMVWRRKVRWRTPGNVVAEMLEIRDRLGIDKIHFWDDNLMLNRAYAEGLAQGLVDAEARMEWVGLTRASHIVKHRDLLPLMRESGCIGIEIGLESFSDQAAAMVDKGEATSEMTEASEAMRSADIVPLYTHMVFNPGETISSYTRKREFLRTMGSPEFNSDGELGQCATPHVETGFAAEASELGMVLAKRYQDYVHHRVNFVPHSLLDDVPVRRGPTCEITPAIEEFLQQTVLPCLHSFEPRMERELPRAIQRTWQLIDESRTVRQIAEKLRRDTSWTEAKSLTYTALAVVGLSMHHLITSRAVSEHDDTRNPVPLTR